MPARSTASVRSSKQSTTSFPRFLFLSPFSLYGSATPVTGGEESDRRYGAGDIVVAGRGIVALDFAVGVDFSYRPDLVVKTTSNAGSDGATGAGRAPDGLVVGDLRAVEVQDRVGVGGDQRPSGSRVGVADAATQGVAAVAASPTLGQITTDRAVDQFEGGGLEGEPAVVDAAAHGVAAVAPGGAGAAYRLVVGDRGVGNGGGPAAFVGEAAAPTQAAVAADGAGAAARSATGPTLRRVPSDGTV